MNKTIMMFSIVFLTLYYGLLPAEGTHISNVVSDIIVNTNMPSFEERFLNDPSFRQTLPEGFEYVREDAFKGWGMADLLTCYTALKTPVKHRLILLEMEREASVFGINSESDKKFCALFESEPKMELARLLGYCKSTKSIELLNASVNVAINPVLHKTAILALARRGDTNALTQVYDNLWRELDIARPADSILIEAADTVSYVRSVECTLLFFDMIVRANKTTYDKDMFMASFVPQMYSHMKKYLAQAGYDVPIKENGALLREWWMQHRGQVRDKLFMFGDALPSLTLTFHIVRY